MPSSRVSHWFYQKLSSRWRAQECTSVSAGSASPAPVCLLCEGRTNLQSIHRLLQLLHLLEAVVNLLLDLGLRGAEPLLQERASKDGLTIPACVCVAHGAVGFL